MIVTLVAAPSAAPAFEIHLPLNCTPGNDCAIQHYVDQDPGEGFRDYRSGQQSYDGHSGTDFRVPTLRSVANGVEVIAAAAGKVVAARDGMRDIPLKRGTADAVAGRECGNGVLIRHGSGWETQYCHMKQGSLLVEIGQDVAAGETLGLVGLSGATEFPHLHFTVRKDGETIDPFDPEPPFAKSPTGASSPVGLWAPELKELLEYRPAFVLNVGFSDAPVAMEQIESGKLDDIKLSRDSPAIVFYGRAIGLEAGDVQRLSLIGPDGEVFASSDVEPVEGPKAQYFAFAGKKLRNRLWMPGTYRGRYSVYRNGAEVAFKEAEIEVPP